jgi:hypothetical protein
MFKRLASFVRTLQHNDDSSSFKIFVTFSEVTIYFWLRTKHQSEKEVYANGMGVCNAVVFYVNSRF